ncbi:hypothetical protein D3C87_1528530 [compost metagenome]
MNPLAQRIGAKAAQQRGDLRRPFGVAREERGVGFGMGDVHAADSGEQKFPSYRGHAVVQVDLDPGLAQHFGRHETGGAAADDGDLRGEGSAGLSHGRSCGVADLARILAVHDYCGSGLARDSGLSVNKDVDVPASSRASPLPQGSVVFANAG